MSQVLCSITTCAEGERVLYDCFSTWKKSVYTSHLSAPLTSTQPHPASMNVMRLTDAVTLIIIGVLSGNRIIPGLLELKHGPVMRWTKI